MEQRRLSKMVNEENNFKVKNYIGINCIISTPLQYLQHVKWQGQFIVMKPRKIINRLGAINVSFLKLPLPQHADIDNYKGAVRKKIQP